MLAKVYSVAVNGLEAHSVEVEVDLAAGLPMFTVVGLPDMTVLESRDRVRSALRNSGFSFPQRKITINLAPADLRKEGSGFDLPMAVGILAAEGLVPAEVLREIVMVGEVSLEGGVKPVHGVLSMALACRRRAVKGLLVPVENAQGVASSMPSGRWKSRRPAAITCCSSARRDPARRCWRSGCPGCFPR